MKIKLSSTFFLTVIVVAPAASAMTIAEYISFDENKRANHMAKLIVKETEKAKKVDLMKGRCLESYFFSVDDDNDGIFDGHVFIAKQVYKAYANPKYRNTKTIEDLVDRSAKYLTKKFCSGTK